MRGVRGFCWEVDLIAFLNYGSTWLATLRRSVANRIDPLTIRGCGWFGEAALHSVVDELLPAARHDLRGQHREPVGFEERPGGDARLGKEPGKPKSPGLGHQSGEQLPP